MPSLATSTPQQLQSLNMNGEDKTRKKTRICILTSRLHCKSSQKAVSNGLRPEELIQWSQSLERLLASKYGTVVFKTFLKSEFSDENIEFWLVCEDYKKIKSSFRMSSKAMKIYKRYVQAEAPREINIDHKTRDLIRRNVKAPSSVCFDEAQRIVYGLMEGDSYPRFIRSDVYKTLIHST
ncbi:regulator of G-protein signaling 13 [Osmerus eperlanus]|uniref:regulator of G-protein signaling 13 n=1 Tax=Osmerus eperlanus TaxID=29151 RepID=UPI002E0E4BC9